MLNLERLSRALVLGCLMLITSLLQAADPAAPLNPWKGFTRSPFTAEVELYSGGITGQRLGAAFDSVTRGDYGARFTFGFLRALNFSLDYMYSNQTRSFTAVSPLAGTPEQGTLLMRAANLHVFTGNGEFNLIHTRRAIFYLSPGVGVARNGARSMTLISPFGTLTSPIGAGTAATFNLGMGVKVYPAKHFGLRFDVRDYVSDRATGNLNGQSNLVCVQVFPPPPACQAVDEFTSAQRYFGAIPVQNNLVFTVGLIFRIL